MHACNSPCTPRRCRASYCRWSAATSLPTVKTLLGPYLVFLSATVNGYEKLKWWLSTSWGPSTVSNLGILFSQVFQVLVLQLIKAVWGLDVVLLLKLKAAHEDHETSSWRGRNITMKKRMTLEIKERLLTWIKTNHVKTTTVSWALHHGFYGIFSHVEDGTLQ